MKTLIVLFFSCIVISVIAQDTIPKVAEIPQGIIYVRKSNIIPYVKVEYKYYLSKVSMVRENKTVTDPIAGNIIEVDNVPVFDSTVYSPKLKRVYPRETQLLSKLFVENMNFKFNANDTPRVDTLVIGMWIDSKGRIKRVLDDPEYTFKMSDELVKELTRTSQQISIWGDAGGYYEKKKLFRKSPLILESYYCEVFVIVSSYPLLVEQKNSRYAPFDYPLNSPPLDEQQKKSMEKNTNVPSEK